MNSRADQSPVAAATARRALAAIRARTTIRARRARESLPAGALDCVVASNEHGVYCLPRRALHRPATQAVLSARTWEPDTLALLCGEQRSGDVVHAGTFFGDFIPALARSRADGARVWAFEPNRENHRCAQVTVLLNELDNVVLVHAALDEREGEGLLAIGDASGLALGGASHLIAETGDGGEPVERRPAAEGARGAGRRRCAARSERVPLATIDGTVDPERRVAVIQLDVEGHERDALAGARRTIERCRPLIVLESLPDASWLQANLAPLGYTVTGSMDANSILRPLARERPSQRGIRAD